MRFKFNKDDSVLIGFSQFEFADLEKEYLADYLLGKLDNSLILEHGKVNERQTLLNWLPFIEMIVIYSTEEIKLEDNEVAIVFKNGISEIVVMEVSKDLYDFLIGKADSIY